MDRVRAAILARVSSDGQDVAAQLEDMRARVRRDGAELVAEYVDDGVSGRTGNLHRRADLLRMIADLAKRPPPFDVLYFFDFDRLARSSDIEEQARILGPLQRAGVALRTRSGEQPSLQTSIGRLVAHLQMDASADWLDKHKAQIKRGKDAAIAAGRKPAGPTPYGWTYDRESGAWGIDETAAEVHREIHRRAAAGASCEAIARDLEARPGLERPRGGHWSRERVWALLTSRTAVGEWTADKRRKLVVKVPPIIDEATWRATQAALAAQGKRGLRRTRHVYLLEAIGVCDLCQGRMRLSAASVVGKRPAYYVCGRRLRRLAGVEPCTLPMARVGDVDAEAWAAVHQVLERPDVLEHALLERRAGAAGAVHTAADDVREAEAQLAELARRERAVGERYAAGAVPDAAFEAANRELLRRRRALEHQLEAARAEAAGAERERADVQAVIATVGGLRARAADAGPEERQAIVRDVVVRAVFTPSGEVRLELAVRTQAGQVAIPSLRVA